MAVELVEQHVLAVGTHGKILTEAMERRIKISNYVWLPILHFLMRQETIDIIRFDRLAFRGGEIVRGRNLADFAVALEEGIAYGRILTCEGPMVRGIDGKIYPRTFAEERDIEATSPYEAKPVDVARVAKFIRGCEEALMVV